MLKLSHYSNLCVSILTSACFDSLSTKTPTIEYYNVEKEISLSNNAIKSYHMVFDRKKKKWVTIFNYKGLLRTIDNKILVMEDSTMILTKSLIKTDKPEI